MSDNIFDLANEREDSRQRLEELRAKYRQTLESQISDISHAWRRIRSAVDWTDELDQLIEDTMEKAHRLAGSAGTFGYEATSDMAAPMEYILRHIRESKTFPGMERAKQVEVLVSELVETLDETAPMHFARAFLGDNGHRRSNIVYLISKDTEDTMGLARRIGHFGYEVTIFDELAAAAEAIEETPPAAALLDMTGFANKAGALALVDRYQPHLPVLMVVAADDFETRLMVAKVGGKGFMLKPVDVEELLVWLDRLTGRSQDNPFEVLIIDDDIALAQCYAVILGQAGMQADVLDDPTHILDVLSASQPDVILIDVFMKAMSGIDLAKVIRQQQHLIGIPIIFMASDHDTSRRYQAMVYGGDDIVELPVKPTELVLAVANRAARARSLRAVMERDSLTGLLNHAMVKERLAQEVDRAHRLGRPVSFALLDLDNFKKVNDTYGHVAGDVVLKTLSKFLQGRMRKTDIVGRYGGEEFAIVLTDSTAPNAVLVMDKVREEFAKIKHHAGDQVFNVMLSCGVAEVEEKEQVADDLIQRADERLYKAKELGRNQIVGPEQD